MLVDNTFYQSKTHKYNTQILGNRIEKNALVSDDTQTYSSIRFWTNTTSSFRLIFHLLRRGWGGCGKGKEILIKQLHAAFPAARIHSQNLGVLDLIQLRIRWPKHSNQSEELTKVFRMSKGKEKSKPNCSLFWIQLGRNQVKAARRKYIKRSAHSFVHCAENVEDRQRVAYDHSNRRG